MMLKVILNVSFNIAIAKGKLKKDVKGIKIMTEHFFIK
uniref:Uncharacterized protein n=1 Tax=Anguilla anguilla TaxID=7936 RepID=A0A0E9UTU7_ANGAN